MNCRWSGALLSLLFVAPVWATDGDADEKARQEVLDVVRQVQARYEKTKDLQADFSQKTRIEGFERPVVSSGKVYLKKPGRLRWDYLDPAVEEIYVVHDDVKVYVPEHKQVLIGKLSQMAASKAPLELLQGAAKLGESFDIEPTTGKERGIGGLRLITLIPKTQNHESTRNLQRIVVEVFPKTYFLRTVSLHEISGNVATFEFSGLKPNLGLGNDVFDFKAPPDVEVVKAPVLNGP
ncbi:MAG TPA: outer membrane lipoprotein carrier protein LolA [Nitrospira sp.]|nr:outer membrane lipoprotein carrier protein LolA [Nitrospira sp.]